MLGCEDGGWRMEDGVEPPHAMWKIVTASRYFFGSSNSQYTVCTPHFNAASSCGRLRTSTIRVGSGVWGLGSGGAAWAHFSRTGTPDARPHRLGCARSVSSSVTAS